MNYQTLIRLTSLLQQACPQVEGVGIGTWLDRNTWRVSLSGAVSEQQAAEIAAVIAAFDPNFEPLPDLEPDQFWFVVRVSGYEPDLLAWVAAMNEPQSPTYDPVGWAAASAKLDFAKYFERDHPFIAAARLAIGMTMEELDSLWVFAMEPDAPV